MTARRFGWWFAGALLVLLVACTAAPLPPAATPDWLWMPVWGEATVVAFDPAQQAMGGTAVTPALAIGLGAGRLPYALAFDDAGNAWVGTQAGEILRIDAADLTASGTPLPGVVLDSGSSDVRAIVFGGDGTLWATVATGIRGWRADQILVSGAPVPEVEIAGTAGAPLVYPTDLVFDGDGGLWVGAGTHVARYAPSQLLNSGAPEPDVVLVSDGTSLDYVRGLTLDPAGALWVSASGSTAVEKFRPEDLAASGPATPVVRLTGPGPTPLRVAFDDEGRLWASSIFGPAFVGNGFVGSVLPAEQVATGAMTLDVGFFDVGSFDAGGTIVFAPGPD